MNKREFVEIWTFQGESPVCHWNDHQNKTNEFECIGENKRSFANMTYWRNLFLLKQHSEDQRELKDVVSADCIQDSIGSPSMSPLVGSHPKIPHRD